MGLLDGLLVPSLICSFRIAINFLLTSRERLSNKAIESAILTSEFDTSFSVMKKLRNLEIGTSEKLSKWDDNEE